MLTNASSTTHAPEHEIKLVTPAARARVVGTWLGGRCFADPEFSEGAVSSIYFDDPELSRLRAKVNSDFLKDKVRVRWYGDGNTPATAFLEVKRKVGARRFKTRVPISGDDVPAAASGDLAAAARLLAPLQELDHAPSVDLQPFLLVSFRRRRFVEPTSRARVSLDADIRGRSVHPGLLPMRHPAPLAHAVLEVKSPRDTLPPGLAWLPGLGCRRESFSKYARCYQKITRQSSF